MSLQEQVENILHKRYYNVNKILDSIDDKIVYHNIDNLIVDIANCGQEIIDLKIIENLNRVDINDLLASGWDDLISVIFSYQTIRIDRMPLSPIMYNQVWYVRNETEELYIVANIDEYESEAKSIDIVHDKLLRGFLEQYFDYFLYRKQHNTILAYHGFSCYINQSVHDDDLDMAEWTVEFGNSKFLLTVSKTYNERDFELKEVFL